MGGKKRSATASLSSSVPSKAVPAAASVSVDPSLAPSESTTDASPVSLPASLAALDISQDEYSIPIENDCSEVVQCKPALILRSDKTNKSSHYITFLPAGAKVPTAVFIDTDPKVVKQAAKWADWTDPLPAPAKERCYEIKSVDGKRPSFYAKRDIKAGELIVKEK